MMESKAIWTNYKIYAFILGIITGTIVYNLLGIDFSFSMINKVEIKDFWDSYLYLLLSDLKFFIFIFIISFFRIKNKIVLLIMFIQAFIISGIITISILSHNMILLYGIPVSVIKIFSTIAMFSDSRQPQNRIIGFLIVITGIMAENFLIIYF